MQFRAGALRLLYRSASAIAAQLCHFKFTWNRKRAVVRSQFFHNVGIVNGPIRRATTTSWDDFIATVLANAGGILGFSREPAAEPVISFQVTDLALVGHGILQYADQAHGDSWQRLILGLVELPR